MDIEALREYCLAKPAVEESFPFGETTLVFKVKGKIFLLTGLDSPVLEFNVKCDPEKAVEWREQFAAVQPGYHMNKKHWNTLFLDASLPRPLVKKLIDHSHDLVSGKFKALAKAEAKLVPRKAKA